MKNKLSALKIIFIIWLLLYPTFSFSEPFVVLEYRGHSVKEQFETDNVFLNDLNHSSKHIVLKNETLSDIMLNYYGTKSFNNHILSLAIVHFNKNAFVRNNPNYLYSGKKLYLPSINEIRNLIIKKNKKIDSKKQYNSPSSSQIYFFGGWSLLKKLFYYVLTILIISTISKQTIAITGKEVSEKISTWLLTQGIEGKPLFSKTIVFKDCGSDIQINKAYNSYKTLNVKCLEKNGFNLFVRIKLNKFVKDNKKNKIIPKVTNRNTNMISSKELKKNKTFHTVRLRRSLEKNDIIKIEDLDLIITSKSYEKSFFNNKEDLVGRKLKKNLKVDQLLHPRHLYEKFEVNIGDFLSIVSQMGNASVAVAGEAKDSGNLGDIIKVKNLRSGKVIKGYVNKNKIIRVFR